MYALFSQISRSLLIFLFPVFGLPPDVVAAALGNIGIVEIAELASLVSRCTFTSKTFLTSIQIPDNIISGLDECIKRCGITPGKDLFKQQQPRIAANALPSGYGQPPSSSTSSVSPSSTSSTGHEISGAVSDDDAENSSDPFSANNKNRSLIIGLIAACGVMALGYIALALASLCRRKNGARAGGASYVRTGEQFAPGGHYEGDKYDSSEAHGLRTPYDAPTGSH